MTIQWYPGHMAKAKRVLKEHLKLVDIVLELRDARIPDSSSNPDLDQLIQGKDRVIVLNKKDLASPKMTQEWIQHLEKTAPTVAVNAITGDGVRDVLKYVQVKADAINARLKKRGRNPRYIRLLIIGIPNIGKSALINKITKRAGAKVENRPGVTRGKQWIKVQEGLLLMDSPGILWPKFEDQTVGLRLASTGAIRSEIFDEEEVAYHLISWLIENAPEELTSFFGVDLLDDPYEMMLAIGKRRGLIMSGGRVRTEQTATMILKEFRDGRIGLISLERPQSEEENSEGEMDE